MDNYRTVNLLDVASLERAQAGKVYPAGSTIIQISATRGQTIYLEEAGEVESHYVVIVPEVECDPYYLYIVIERAMPWFCHTYQNGLNIVPSEFKHLKIGWHNLADQKKIARMLRTVAGMERRQEEAIDQARMVKKDYLQNMFV